LAAFGLVLSACTISPLPLSEAELAMKADDAMVRVTSGQEPVAGRISLYEAMARALKYNLDYRTEMFARSLADAKLDLAKADLLPSLVANGHWSDRKDGSYSYSETLSGIRSLEPSTSRDNENLSKDLTFSWHILDFGLSYVRAKQAADRAVLAEEQKRKVINRIIEDVRTAYWRAVSADRLLAGFRSLEARAEKALANSRALQRDGFTSPLAALTYQRELVDIKRDIQRLERELSTAKVQLAALMNVDPASRYELVLPERKLAGISLKIPSEEMVRLAMLNRPELREVAYKARINEREAEAALLELLPGIQLYAGANFDSNSFLLDNSWVSWGAKASWNAMRLFAYPAKKSVISAESALIDNQALATTMAIMTQVEVARLRYHYLRKSAQTAAEYHQVQAQILKQVRASAGVDADSEQALIREEMNALVASAEFDVAFADLQNAFAAIYTSIGVDPWGDALDLSGSVQEIAAGLRQVWLERGDIGS
jgi:outer membrane protein TolC